MSTERADKILVQLGLVPSRTLARKLIESGHVEACIANQWKVIKKPSEKWDTTLKFRVKPHEEQRFVSRAGLKLDAALDRADIQVEGLSALDIGQSTGGFTDCLLQRGCVSVTGVEVGRDQLVPTLRADPRVSCIEGLNARLLTPEDVAPPYGIAVMDVSFISQTLVLPKLPALLCHGGLLISLVKPQFELAPEDIGKGGIVKSVARYPEIEQKVTTLMESLGFSVDAYFESSIKGGDGNTEFFAVARFKGLS